MVFKTDRDKAMAAIRDYYDKYPANHVIDARYLQQRFGFSEVYAAEVIRVLVASDLITYDPELGGPEPYIRLKPKGQVYAEVQADMKDVERKATKQFKISTAIAVLALLIALLDLLKGCLW